ncbi:MAG: radical SAM protein [Desulfobulbus propionicus]|nr:MAG: radical SAM protein [Desulfobulbus propionicus]
MQYEGQIFRPPSEAGSILLQVTTGCPHNRCSFCGMYRDVPFSIKDDAVIDADIQFAASHCRHQRNLFLCDGDALIIPQQRLVAILTSIARKLPWVRRVGLYASARSVATKTEEELCELRRLGVRVAYLGLESGDDLTLAAIDKGADAAMMIRMSHRLRQAGISLFLTVLLGIAGQERSLVHARETARVLSLIDPQFVGVLSLIPTPGTPMYAAIEAGRFILPGPMELLEELAVLVAATEMSGGYLYTDHASNFLPMRVKMPREKAQALHDIDQALQGRGLLRPPGERRTL